GPICMGVRLSTPRSASAYQGVTYSKGGYVLHMLRSLMWDPQTGDQNFIATLHDFVQTYLYKPASTEDFQAVVEKHMTRSLNLTGNGKMDWFFQEWVYGTDIPKYKFDYELMPEADGKVRLKATLTQSGVSDTFRMGVPVSIDVDGRIVRAAMINMAGN